MSEGTRESESGTDGYAFDDRILLDPVRPGTTLLIAGPTHGGARELALSMLAAREDEGTVIVTTSEGPDRIVSDCQSLGGSFAPGRVGVVDCVGDDRDPDGSFPARVLAVSGPEDLTGIGIRYSNLYQNLLAEDVTRVRSGVLSVSALLTPGEIQAVSRFVHTLVGRIDAVDGLGVMLIDPTTQDERTVRTIAQFCGGRVDVRDENGPELRVRGFGSGPREWTAFDPRA